MSIAGRYALERRVFERTPLAADFSFEQALLAHAAATCFAGRVAGDALHIDIGGADDHHRAPTLWAPT